MKRDNIALRIEAFGAVNGGGVSWYKNKGECHLCFLTSETLIARPKAPGTTDEIRIDYWSRRRKWEDIDDMGGCVLPLDQALYHIASVV